MRLLALLKLNIVAAAVATVLGPQAFAAPDAAKVAWMLQTNLLENSSAEAVKDIPKVLVLGDSISMGYTPFLKRQLMGVADVRRPRCNCGATQFYLRERGGMKDWVGTNRWDVITVNAGIWDICYMKGSATGCDHYWGPGKNKELAKLAPIPRGTAIRKLGYRVRTPILEYMANLRKILTYLKSTGATVIFPLTTPAVGYQVDDRCGLFRVYNEVAQAVCDELGVKTLDFYALAEEDYSRIYDGAHFNEAGSGILASALSKEIVKALRARGRTVEDHVETPRILAHRGSRGEYQDNAAGGFTKCLNAGVTGFEVDIRMTKDGHLVVMHDARLERTTDGKGVVEELTLAEIRKCRLKNCSETVPTIEEVLKRLSGRDDIFIELEMKGAAATKKGRLEEYCRKLNEVAGRMLKPGTFAFTSFDEDYLATMKRVDPSARTGLIRSRAISEIDINRALELGCGQIAPLLKGSTKDLVDLAHAKGLKVTLWMVQNRADYLAAKALGADATTSDYPILLRQRVRGVRKKLVALDLDATLCQHRSPIPPENLAALRKLQERYRCIMVGAGNAPRIYKQMGNHPIEIVGNYGMQEAQVVNGELRIVRAVTNEVDKAFFREKTDYLRKKYGYTEYAGEPIEFHASGMVTFGLLGTAAKRDDKVKFDPDRKKRRAMYKEVCDIFKDYAAYIGGSTSFDFAGKRYNKYDATLDWAKRHGYELDDIVFIGDDFADGGGDSHVRTKDTPKLGGYPRMDYIVINDYKKFHEAVGVLLR